MKRPAAKPTRHRQVQGPPRRTSHGVPKGRGGHYPEIFQPSPFTEESRRKRARERRRRKFAGWPSRLMLFLSVLVAAFLLVAYLPEFTLEEVTVTGIRLADEDLVRSLARQKVGDHFLQGLGGSAGRLLTLRYGALERAILEACPIVREVKVSFHYPSGIRVALDEKVEVLAVRVPGAYALLDRDYRILRFRTEDDFALPVLEGVILSGGPVAGEVLPVEDTGQLDAACRLLAALILHDQTEAAPLKLMGTVRQFRQIEGPLFFLFIPLSRGGEIRVRLEDNRQVQDKLSLLSYLLSREDLVPQVAGELDLSGETAYFRPDTGGLEIIQPGDS